ncbi:MAG: META domain-containing protein [Cyclobacteriaceae bacterium]|nr:META domain-containing protein [Cyclobacteriaceae bacterium]
MQNIKSRFLFLLLALMVFWSSCTSILYVAPRQVDCTGVSDQKCYLIRRSPGENWVSHYHEIQGLDYEPGFSYKIKVKKEHIKNPPVGASSFRLILVETLDMTDVTEDLDIDDLAGKDWKLEFLKQERVEIGIEKQIPTIRFETDGKISGFGGCNNFFGSFTLNGRTIKNSDIGSTRKFCDGAMDLENAYFKVLEMEFRALFVGGKLILTGDGGNQMIFGYK